MRAKKSQLTLEFLFLIGFVAIMSFGFIYAAGFKIKEYSDSEVSSMIVDFGNSIKRELTVASIVKDGYIREFTLPSKINGELNYTIALYDDALVIRTDFEDYTALIPNTNGQLQKGDNIIRKSNNTIFIENV